MPESSHKLGAVIYTDGSAKPNPGFIGWGMHGYLYTTAPSKQGPGINKHKITETGYMHSNRVTSPLVTPIKYYDFIGSKVGKGTNNEAELTALVCSLQQLLNENISKLQVYTDSDYLVKGIKHGIPNWKKTNWRKSDGELLNNANLWQAIDDLLNTYASKNIDVNVDWVKGHNDNFGNLIADKLAKIGVNYSINEIDKLDYKITPSKGYWSKEINKHPFIDHKRLYFNSNSAYNIPGHYFLAKPGHDDNIIGKKTPDAGYSLIRLNNPDPVLECIKEFQSIISADMNNIAVMRLEKIFNPDVYETILEHKFQSMVCDNEYNPSVNFIDDKPLTVIQNPPGLCLRAIQISGILEELLDSYIANKNNISIVIDWPNVKKHDITDVFYKPIKDNKKELHSKFGVGFDSIEIPVIVRYKDSDIKLKVVLSLGLDLPSRNSLKRIEKLNPLITLLTWQEGSRCFRYASIVEIKDAIGIWSNYFGNQIFV